MPSRTPQRPAPAPLTPAAPVPDIDRLSVAQEAFRTYYASCFWFMAPELVVTEALLPLIAEGLRHHGDRKAFQIAQTLC